MPRNRVNRRKIALNSPQTEIILSPSDDHQHSGLGVDKVIVKTQAATTCVPQAVQFLDRGDGELIELVRAPDNYQKAALLLWRNGAASLHDRLCKGTNEYVPLSLEASVFNSIRLPETAAPGSTAEGLVSEMAECLRTYLDIDRESLRLVTYFVLYTWFQDHIPIAPYLSVVGAYSSGKTTLLRLLHSLCRRPLVLSDFTTAALYRLPSSISPTMLIDEFEESVGNSRNRELLKLLRSGSSKGAGVYRSNKLYQTFCAKVIVG